jgi:hypothetical protein
VKRKFTFAMRLVVFVGLLAALFTPVKSIQAASYIVTNTNDSGPGSLRQAILDATSHAGTDTIHFNIPTSDPGYSPGTTGGWIIQPASPLPSLTGSETIIDGATQTANQGNTNPLGPEITVDGLYLGSGSCVFSVQSNANQILSLAITGGEYCGVKLIAGASGNIIKDNYIGIAANVSSGPWANGYGILALGGAHGNVFAHNVISNNVLDGIFIAGSGTDDNMIRRNIIGLDPNGTTAKPNNRHGILILNGPSGNTVGGEVGYRNTISQNKKHGVYVSMADNNNVTYNYIGLDLNGLKDMGNQFSGVAIDSGSRGTYVSHNVISGNDQHGVFISGSGTDFNTVADNIIGWDKDIYDLVPNNWHGVSIYGGAQYNLIGATLSSTYSNQICCSSWSGVVIVNPGSDHNTVSYNLILGNKYYGVGVVGGADNLIRYNWIIGNGGTNKAGVLVDGASALGNRISRNSIFYNSGKGIELINSGNGGILKPTITQASCQQVTGTTCPGCKVEIFSDSEDEGRIFEGDTIAHASLGTFSWINPVHGPNLTVTTTDLLGNTSEFSSPFHVGGCKKLFLPLVKCN